MSKIKLWIFTIAMTFVLLALIAVQTYWIISAYEVKEEKFRHLVNSSLNNITKKIEAHETVLEVTNEIISVTTDSLGKTDNFDLHNFFTSDSLIQNKFNTSSENAFIWSNGTYTFKRDHEQNVLRYDTLNTKKTFGPDRNRITERLLKENKSVFVENIVKKLTRKKVTIEERVNNEALDSIIRIEFYNHGIEMPFEYAVKKSDSLQTVQSSNFDSQTLTDYYVFETKLFPDDLFNTPYYLLLYFPEHQRSIFSSIALMAGTSIVLTLIIIFSFFANIFIIVKQKKLSKMKNDFVNNMTHEFKTPISTISLASQMLKDESIPKELKDLGFISKLIDDESKRLGQQVEKVLQMAIFDKGKFILQTKEISLNKLLTKVADNFEIHIKNQNGTLTRDITDTDIRIMADEVHLSNAFRNLMDNAIKYSKDVPEISILLAKNKNDIIITVKDNGIGISKDNLNKVFDRFYRVHTGNIHDVKGFGLGLSYVKKIVEEHGGKIKIKSELKKGSEFSIILPA